MTNMTIAEKSFMKSVTIIDLNEYFRRIEKISKNQVKTKTQKSPRYDQ